MLGSRCLQTLMQHRMAPGRVAADQDDQIGLFPVLVNAGDHVLAERAHMTGDRGCHAQPRIRIDVGAADETLHQLVGNVIIFRQALSGNIKSDAVRSMFRDRRAKPVCDQIERLIPTGRLPMHRRFG